MITGEDWHCARLTTSRAETAHEIDRQADQQNQAKSAATDKRTTEVKTATTEQEEQDQHEQDCIHAAS